MRNRKINASGPLTAGASRRAVLPSSHPSRRERRRNEVRERIFRAALHLFAEHGYLETTVEDITEAADVGKGTFFNYFPTKEHVLATYGDERVSTVERALQKARAGKGPVLAVLKGLATSLAGQSSASPELLRSIFAAHLSSAPIRAELQKRMQRARHLMTELFALAQARGEIRHDRSAAGLARMTHIIFMGVTIAWAVNPDSSLQRSAEEVWDMICPSLRAKKGRKEKKRS
jgi:AcrR family transcriptional regulator